MRQNIGQKVSSGNRQKEHSYDAEEQKMFFTTLWLGAACLYVWLLMSFIF